MTDYFSITTSKRANEACRIAADMRLSFIANPNTNLPLLKAFKRLVLSQNDPCLNYYFMQYFRFYDWTDFNLFKDNSSIDSNDEIVVEDMRQRIDHYMHPKNKYLKEKELKLNIPQDKTKAPIVEKIVVRNPNQSENE